MTKQGEKERQSTVSVCYWDGTVTRRYDVGGGLFTAQGSRKPEEPKKEEKEEEKT